MTTTKSGIDRRGFLKTFLVTGAGVTALPTIANAAWVTWDPRGRSQELVNTDDFDLENEAIAEGLALGDPSLAFGDGEWLAFTDMQGDNERVLLKPLFSNSELIVVNEGRGPLACHPQVVSTKYNMNQTIVWVEQGVESNALVMREFSSNTGMFRGEAQVIREAPGLLRPRLLAVPLGVIAVWEEKEGDQHVVMMKRLGDDGEPMHVSREQSRDCRRPAIALSPDLQEIAVAYDVAGRDGGAQVIVRRYGLERLQPDEVNTVTAHPANNIAPSLDYSKDGKLLWIAWHSNRGEDDTFDLPRWFQLAAIDRETNVIKTPPSEPRDKDLTKRDQNQGFEFMTVVACEDGGAWVIGRPSHNFCMQKYHGGQWSDIYRLPVDGWGGRGKHASAHLDSEGALWVARRDIRSVVVAQVGGADGGEFVQPVLVDWNDGPVNRPLANRASKFEYPPETYGPEESPETLNFYYGDIHGHTYMSDGMGDVDEYFRRCRDFHADDFCALTDHDNFVGQRMLNSEYEEQKRAVEHYHDEGNFVTLYAQEWTTGRTSNAFGYGHIILYSKTPDHVLYDHRDEQQRWRTQEQISQKMKEDGMIGGPHHTGWTGYRWDDHDPEVMKHVEICSVHGAFEFEGNRPIPHRGSFSGCFIQDGLARGLKFGIVGGSDQHGLIYHHRVCWKRNAYRAGLTGILAPDLTRDSVWEAFSNRRTFASTGVKIRMGFKINGELMGSEIESDGPPELLVDLIAPSDIQWVEVVRNNRTVKSYGAESLHTFFGWTDEECPIGEEQWYYLRITMEDGNMAWTSPIWVTRTS